MRQKNGSRDDIDVLLVFLLSSPFFSCLFPPISKYFPCFKVSNKQKKMCGQTVVKKKERKKLKEKKEKVVRAIVDCSMSLMCL